MTKKKKTNKSIKKHVSSTNIARGSFMKIIRKSRSGRSKNPPENQAGRSDLQESTADMNLFKSIIKEFSTIRKSDGLITGTNEVLRLLEKEKLIAVFMFKDKATYVIKDSLSKLCKQADVSFIRLEDKDRHILGPEFPKSITYGIKNEPFSGLENLRSLLRELSIKRNKKDDINVDRNGEAASFTYISLNEMKLPSTEITTNQEVLDATAFYHTHEFHVLKKSNTYETGFLSLNKFSADERKTDFLDYDSVACSGVLSIK